MPECNWCHQEMQDRVGCTLRHFEDMPSLDRVVCSSTDACELEHCPDCLCPVGTNHHPGCDRERCPKCGGQAIACHCTVKDDSTV